MYFVYIRFPQLAFRMDRTLSNLGQVSDQFVDGRRDGEMLVISGVKWDGFHGVGVITTQNNAKQDKQ